MSTAIEKFFPIARSLRLPSLGLDISDYSIKYVEVAHTRNGVVIKRFGSVLLEPGVLDRGMIIDQKKLQAAIMGIYKTTKVDFARIAFPDERGFLFNIVLPKISAEEIPQAIRFQIEEQIPVSEEDVVFDYSLNKEKEHEYDIQVTAALKKQMDAYYSAVSDSNIVPKYLELNSQATARAVTFNGQMDNFLLVDFGETSTSIALVRKKRVVLTATLSVGGRDITDQIMKEQNVSLKKAEEIKIRTTLETVEPNSITIKNLNKITDEIKRYYEYWQSHAHFFDGAKESIIMVGGGARLPGLAEFLESKLGMSSHIAKPQFSFSVHKGNRSIFEKGFSSYATALGLALGDFIYD